MKYLGEKTMPDPRTGVPGPFDLFEFECRWCDVRGILGAPILHKEWPFQCTGCSRKYTHWRPVDGAGVPDLVPMVDLCAVLGAGACCCYRTGASVESRAAGDCARYGGSKGDSVFPLP